eukprot:scaffold1610_cov257-Pinguiococcus_pyrenoidosus.AAC.46
MVDGRAAELPNDPVSELRLAGVETLLAFRCHHVVSDGVSMSFVLLDLFDEAERMRKFIEEEIASRMAKARRKSALLKFLTAIAKVVVLLIQGVVGVAHHLYLAATATQPWSLTRRRFEPFPENRFGFRANCISVTDAKELARALSKKATLNDLMLTCLARAVARVCGEELQCHRSVNVSMPVHLQGGVLLKGQGLGNRIGAHTIRLPIIKEDSDIRTQVSQLDEVGHSEILPRRRVTSNCRFAKATPMALVAALSALWTATVLPGQAQQILETASAGTLMTISNVRGPATEVHFNNRPVTAMVPFVPPPPGVPVGVMVGHSQTVLLCSGIARCVTHVILISFLSLVLFLKRTQVSSYNGMLTLTANVDPEIIPDAQAIVDSMLEEYYALKRAARLVTSRNRSQAARQAASQAPAPL